MIVFPTWVKQPTPCTMRTFSVSKFTRHGVTRIEMKAPVK